VLVDNLLHQREPDSNPVTSARVEHVEEPLSVCRADTGAFISNFKKGASRLIAPGSNLDLAATWRRLQRIPDQIPDDLPHSVRVDGHVDRVVRPDLFDPEPVRGHRFAAGYGHHFTRDRAQVERLGFDLTRAPHLEHRGHERVESLDLGNHDTK